MQCGDAVLLDATRPWQADTESFGHNLIVNIRHADVCRDVRSAPAMLGTVLPGGNPTLRIITAMITELGRGASALPGETLTELGHTAAELLISTLRLAERGDNRLADPRQSRHTQLLRMRDFIRHHLADPDLSPRTLADAFDVSLRYVHAVFAEADSSPARFIRDSRMSEARRMLADPRKRHRSIAAIGYSVGIRNPTVFTRTFRERYAVTPRDYRNARG